MLSPTVKLPDREDLPYMKVGFLLCPSFTLTPMACFVDCLRLGADQKDNSRQIYFAWEFIAAGMEPTVASCELVVDATADLKDPRDFDCLVICGGLIRDFEKINPKIYPYLQMANTHGMPIIGLCTGSFVLAQAGLLEGRRLTVAPTVLDEFLTRFDLPSPSSTDAYIVDGNIMTCPGSIAAIDIATFLMQQLGNATRARKAQDYLLYKPESSPFQAKAKPYEEALSAASPLTAKAIHMMEVQMDIPCSIEILAKTLNTTKSRLNRTFSSDLGTSPAAFWRSIRLLAAREMLWGRRLTITEVAYETGFSDAAHFCRIFKRHYNMTPDEFRRQPVSMSV